MKVMVFDVGGTGIKYSVMDEQLNRTDTGSTPTPADSQEHFLNTLREIYLPHKDEVDGIALSLPGFIDAEQGVVRGGGAPSLAYNVGTPVGPRRRSTREYPGHRKESFPNNRAGSRTNSHKTTTFPIPKPLRPDIHVPCRTLHPSAKSPTPRADYPQKHPAAPAAIRFYPSSNLLLHSPRRAGRRTRPRAGNITTTARQAKCQPRRVE